MTYYTLTDEGYVRRVTPDAYRTWVEEMSTRDPDPRDIAEVEIEGNRVTLRFDGESPHDPIHGPLVWVVELHRTDALIPTSSARFLSLDAANEAYTAHYLRLKAELMDEVPRERETSGDVDDVDPHPFSYRPDAP